MYLPIFIDYLNIHVCFLGASIVQRILMRVRSFGI